MAIRFLESFDIGPVKYEYAEGAPWGESEEWPGLLGHEGKALVATNLPGSGEVHFSELPPSGDVDYWCIGFAATRHSTGSGGTSRSSTGFRLHTTGGSYVGIGGTGSAIRMFYDPTSDSAFAWLGMDQEEAHFEVEYIREGTDTRVRGYKNGELTDETVISVPFWRPDYIRLEEGAGFDGTGAVIDHFYYLDDQGESPTGRIGVTPVGVLQPTAVGQHDDFDSYDPEVPKIDALKDHDLSALVYASDPNAEDSYTFSNITSPYTLLGMQVILAHSNGASDDREIAPTVVDAQGTTGELLTPTAMPEEPVKMIRMFTTNPLTGQTFTTQDVNDLEFGFKVEEAP